MLVLLCVGCVALYIVICLKVVCYFECGILLYLSQRVKPHLLFNK
jgi:hypothetical protein